MDYARIMNEIHSPESNPQRSGKDLSHRKVLTMKAGELLPILWKELVPKDYVEVDLAALVRTVLPLNTAAFMRSKIHFDFFFVPYTSIWRNYDKFYYQRDDNYTSYSRDSKYEPNVTLENVMDSIEFGSQVMPQDSVGARCKLAQLMGYGNYVDVDSSDFAAGGTYESIAQKSLTALPMYAYHRIFNMHYRDAWKDQPNSNDVELMSADNIYCNTYATSLVNYGWAPPYSPGSVPADIFKMHYHKYPQDLFMGLLPNAQFGTVSTINTVGLAGWAGTTGNDRDRWSPVGSSPTWGDNKNVITSNSSNSGNENLVFEASSGSTIAIQHDHTFTVNVSGQNVSSFDVLTLRKAIASQKWKEYNMRAGWKSGKQARAMFGVDTPDDRKHDVQFIDSYQFPIMVDEVVQQSSTVSSGGVTQQLGELGGKVIGIGNGHKIKFTSGERHGIFMCIAYILPQVEYNAAGIDKQLVRSVPEDHFMPAYQNLGLEPVYKYELNALGNPVNFDAVLGYVPRYHEYKTDYDKVYCDFNTGKGLQSWVTARRDLQRIVNGGSIPVSYLYVDPSIMDTMFITNAGAYVDTDQFMLNVNFDLKMVRPMSDLGLPTL